MMIDEAMATRHIYFSGLHWLLGDDDTLQVKHFSSSAALCSLYPCVSGRRDWMKAEHVAVRDHHEPLDIILMANILFYTLRFRRPSTSNE